MKIGALVRSYGSTQYLGSVLKHLKGSVVDRILVLNNRFDEVASTPDNTKEIADSFGVDVVVADGIARRGACNVGMDILSDCDFVFYNDADEFVMHEDMRKMLDEMIKQNKTVGMLNVIDYASLTTAFAKRTHRPHYLIKSGVKAQMERCFDGDNFVLDADMHHFGYFLRDDITEWKLKNLWYDNKHDYDRVVCTPKRSVVMPDEIRCLVDKCV